MTNESAYAQAGVDVTRGYKAVDLMKEHVKRTRIPGVVGGIGGFAGLFDIGGGRLLAAGADGVGTKLRLAIIADKHDTVGIDCVAMSVNDVAVTGAIPLFFLDYIACGKIIPDKVADIVKGVADGCVQAGCALLGGETAEMPGFYAEDDYDLAGFAVGAVERTRMLDKSNVRAGDMLIALPSSGVHSNGFSLIRKIYGEEHLRRDSALLETLLTPTKIYVKPLAKLIEACLAVSACHITGGGFYENIPRCLPDGLCAKVSKSALRTPDVFRMIKQDGKAEDRDMFGTFNMGVGMVVVARETDVDAALACLADEGAYVLGEVGVGEGVII
ncbi:MAG: phosphoribosylformylglycinamidine cyclo-ligase [Oscillospiraceae bacterium]|jgi:phosphoribosylformylglycinamidine cyclo-ligase|nr:phosphoribosylformylglycinamidine cyclo-ligase [Oscillospiraceae bacterium]